MSTCSAAEIAEKKRIALEKLRARKAQMLSATPQKPAASIPAQTKPTVVPSNNNNLILNLPQKPAPNFYNSSVKPSSGAATPNKASSFLNALKQSSVFTHRKEARDAAHPYQRPAGQAASQQVSSAQQYNNDSGSGGVAAQKPNVAPVFVKAVTCRVYMISVQRFEVQASAYHAKLIEIFKGIASKSYDHKTRNWNFALQDYPMLKQRIAALNPDVVIGNIPKNIMSLCQTSVRELDRSCLTSIEPTLALKLLPFQEDGVCFGIAQHGRVMICDEMGLGKTYQALAIADFYKESWPLLICTTASTRDSWSTHVRQLLPTIPLHYIQVLTNQSQFIGDAKVVITSYNMMEKVMGGKLNDKKFGVLIFDESHTLKNSKAKCTVVADRLAMLARHVVLLSGTPALSRPLELFTQLQMVDRKFMNFIEFTTRYCDGKQTNFGWDASGQSNLTELNVVLKLKYMIRRVKADVLPELAQKYRETVVLDPALVWTNDVAKANLDTFAKNLGACKGREKEEILLKFYAETAKVKTRAVCAYLKTLVNEEMKFIVFGHHRVMLDAISDCLQQLKVKYVRIDGSTRQDHRTEYINKFQNKSAYKVAVLSLKACNAGITLTAAEMIIFAELDWNPSTLAQAESRAHRIGQTKPVTCRYLIASKTADDVIWNMLKTKQDVLNRAGLFSGDLQEATHTMAPTMSRKIDEFLKPINEQSTASKHVEKDAGKDAEPTKTGVDAVISKELQNLDALFEGDDDDFKDLNF